ncbi:MAG TPA: flagellar motor protein MotB [Steroidobacteraceae bacterium]|nr:flagellar motor protein MotB [Steroidobacteraceae bacterium]
MADEQPIVIKRIYAAQAHHGGSWKVAFADFATAMMAFFLMMWLMGATTADQRGGISQYFKNPSVVQGASPLPSPSAAQGPGGASTSLIKFGGGMEIYADPPKDDGTETDEERAKHKKEEAAAVAVRDVDVEGEAEKERLENLKFGVKAAIDEQPTLKPFSDQVLMDLTAEGLRIQIIDKESRSMFALGSPELEPFGATLLKQLASIIATVPNRISISGHTDSRPYQRLNYSNWELSADRANAARRALIAGGLPEDKIGRVVGLSAFAPLDRDNLQNPMNRRISIIVLNKRTEQAIVQESGALLGVQTNLEPTMEKPAK